MRIDKEFADGRQGRGDDRRSGRDRWLAGDPSHRRLPRHWRCGPEVAPLGPAVVSARRPYRLPQRRARSASASTGQNDYQKHRGSETKDSSERGHGRHAVPPGVHAPHRGRNRSSLPEGRRALRFCSTALVRLRLRGVLDDRLASAAARRPQVFPTRRPAAAFLAADLKRSPDLDDPPLEL